MKKLQISKGTLATLTLALVACAGPALYPTVPTVQNVQSQVDRVQKLAGNDLKQLVRLCNPQPAERAKASEQADDHIRRLIARPAPPPMRVFDNLYYVGGDWVSAWILKTSKGLILIDALNNQQEVQDLIEGGMIKLGLDPKDIRYLVITHGHGDHYGGADYLVRKYGMKVVASDIDWKMMHNHPEFESKVWGPPPPRDVSVKDGDQLQLGDTVMTMHVTPGHSEGTLSPIFEVKNGSQSHAIMLWGGTSFNFGKDFHRLESYSDSTERMRQVAAQRRVEVLISNHASFDNSIFKMKAWAAAHQTGPHPFVTGPEVVDRSLEIMGICARSQHERFRL